MRPGAEAAGEEEVGEEVGHPLPLLQPLAHIQARAYVKGGAVGAGAGAGAGAGEEARIQCYQRTKVRTTDYAQLSPLPLAPLVHRREFDWPLLRRQQHLRQQR